MTAWAMRTSRTTEAHRKYVVAELGKGSLRQGWGYEPDQDLRTVVPLDRSSGWEALSKAQQQTFGHWRMLGDKTDSTNTMLEGDLVLLPNVPDNGLFSICRIEGPYDFKMHDFDVEGVVKPDLGHKRPAINLTPGGIPFKHPLVDPELRRSLKCRLRLWNISKYSISLNAILEASQAGESMRDGIVDHLTRARRAAQASVQDSIRALASRLGSDLAKQLQGAEWETIVQSALIPLFQHVEVDHIAGPTERGADLEIRIPNPFSPTRPWIIAVQIKNYSDKISETAAEQLEQAIIARKDEVGETAVSGGLIAVVLASTDAKPSAELSNRMAELSTEHHVQVSCVSGTELMTMLARGFVASDDWQG